MPDTNELYLQLITSQYADKPLFNEYVKTLLDEISPIIDCLNDFNIVFILDTAVGDQLDKIGQLLDLSRELPVDDPNIPSILTDDTFRLVLKARILANHWDGSNEGLIKIIDTMFPSVSYQLIDGQDMSMTVAIIDPNSTPERIALLLNGYILPKPSGVRVNYTIQDKPLFGWDSDTGFIKGWDEGTWSSD